jgi:hypothetical protein
VKPDLTCTDDNDFQGFSSLASARLMIKYNDQLNELRAWSLEFADKPSMKRLGTSSRPLN